MCPMSCDITDTDESGLLAFSVNLKWVIQSCKTSLRKGTAFREVMQMHHRAVKGWLKMCVFCCIYVVFWPKRYSLSRNQETVTLTFLNFHVLLVKTTSWYPHGCHLDTSIFLPIWTFLCFYIRIKRQSVSLEEGSVRKTGEPVLSKMSPGMIWLGGSKPWHPKSLVGRAAATAGGGFCRERRSDDP